MVTIQKTLNALRGVIHPSSTKNIVDEGLVKNVVIEDGKVTFDLIVNPTAPSIIHEIQMRAQQAVEALDSVTKVVCQVKAVGQPQQARPQVQSPLNNVKNIIAISSAKGGVGKSTMAAHLAKELVNRGLKVGLVDVDIYGPSLPTLFNLPKVDIYMNEQKFLMPVEEDGLKLMSFGFLLGDKPAVMRGPVVTRYVQQILLNTDWGELDYLLIDMPPGTGDIQLTITQSIRLTGAVIITTPHSLSLIDVARGILMFEKVEVPIIGVIENMSYLQAGDEKHYVFGESSVQSLSDRFGVEILGEVPILQELSAVAQTAKKTPCIQTSVDHMLKSVETVRSSAQDVPSIKFDERKVQLSWKNGEHWSVSNFDLRMISQDALSVNEITGQRILKAEDVPDDIAAEEITPLGNYGIGIAWNDGHSAAIYTYKNIRQIATITT